MKNRFHPMRWIIWGLAVAFYLYEFFLRVSPSLMVPQLIGSFEIDAAGVGTLSAFYLYAYTLLQLPIGILMDQIGARRSLTLATLACGIGGLLFGFAPIFWVAALGRVLMGAGSAFAFIGLAYISSYWFPPRMLGTLIGVGTGLGFVGALLADDLLAISVDFLGWRPTSYIGGAVGILLALVMYLAMRREPAAMQQREQGELVELIVGLKRVCRNWQTWLNGAVSLLFYATTTAFGGLWGVTFIAEAYGVTKVEAGLLISLIFLGWVPGGALAGLISDRLGRRKPFLVICPFLAAAALALVIYMPMLPHSYVAALLFMVGLLSSAQVLTFSYAIEVNPGEARGTATALTNFMVMLMGALLQPFVGSLLDLWWEGTMINGVPLYTMSTLQKAMSCFPISLVCAGLLALLYREPSPHSPS